uniref:Secreted protein n=1 Tax=Magallana gigas TaxID=29159 RepID=A0A8W8KIW6_MAGGI
MQSAVLLLLLPVCCGMVIPDGPTPGPPPGCFYNGKHYRPGEIMHSSTEGDCERTISCTEYGPVAGDSRGCFTHHKRAEVSDEPVPSSSDEDEENPKPAVNSTGQVEEKRAEELNDPELDTVDIDQAIPNKPEERSMLNNYDETVRALNYDVEDRP